MIILVHHNACKTKREIFVFVVVKPRPFIKPLTLERTLDHSGLPELPLGESIADCGRTATQAHDLNDQVAESAPAVTWYIGIIRKKSPASR